MALLMSCREVKKDYGETNILNDISFDIAIGERIGLVGLNGSGKTTLANIIAGDLAADSGSLLWHKKSVNIGYLKQESAYMGQKIEEPHMTDYLYTSSMLGLGKINDWDETKLNNLSGGEKTKLSLSKIWVQNPDFLILDEPTNHLDYEGVQWLIKELRKYKGTVLIISHDRFLLDECVTRIVEVENGVLQDYYGNYSLYREEKRKRYESQLNQYLLQEEKKKEINKQINTLKTWSAKAHSDAPAKAAAAGNKKGGKEFLRAKAKKIDIQVKSRIKRLERIKIQGVERPKEEDTISFQLKPASLKGNRIMEARDLAKAFYDKVLFRDSSFYIKRGDKIGIWGENGCGKTTLLKILMGLEGADNGEVFLSTSAKLGYLSQDIAHIDPHKRVSDCFDATTRQERGRLQTLLFNMGFSEDMLVHPIGSLSLGELTRLRIAELIVKECDLLILDEPLNHLDLHSRELLEKVLLDYNGTILLVSHDRYMMDQVCSKLLAFENKSVNRKELRLKEYLADRRNPKKEFPKEAEEKRMVLENEISFVVSALCKYAENTEEYIRMDLRFKELVRQRKELGHS